MPRSPQRAELHTSLARLPRPAINVPGHDTALDIDTLERVLSRIPDAMPLPRALGWLAARLSVPMLSSPIAGIQKILGEATLESPDRRWSSCRR